MKKLLRILASVALILLVALPAIAGASDVPKPDSTPSIIKVFAYENVLILGDQLFVAEINIPYTTIPSTPSSSAYLGRIVDDTGAEVASTPIYSYFNSGYSYNTFALYFNTAIVPWNIVPIYSLSLDGSPTLNWLGVSATTAMSGYIDSAAADKTAEANSVAANDMALLTAVLNSTSYFGSVYNFDKLTVNIGTSGVGVYTTVWEYWNGSGWTALTNVVDGTSYFMAPVGNHDVTFTIPSDWTTSILGGLASQMWIRVRVNSYTSMATPSLGTQSWVNGGSTYPTVAIPSTSFTWNTSTSVATTQNIMYGQIITWADTLGTYWSLPLTTFVGSTKVFSAYGQTYFPGAIPGLQQFCPKLFATTTSVPKYVDKPVNTDVATTVTASWPLDWTGIAHWLGFTGTDNAFRGLICLVGIFFITGLVTTKSAQAAVPVAFALLVGFSAIGWVTPILTAGVAFAAIVIFGLVFLLGKPIT